MAPTPGEQNGEAGVPRAAAGLDALRTLPTPFLTKTYQLVDEPGIDDVISWNDDGSTFVVWRPAEFARDLLPKYFKHNNFSSFVRQLNTYGFRKIVPDRWEFANDCFRRGEKRLLSDIHRHKISPVAVALSAAPIAVARVGSPSNSGEEQVISSNSSLASAAAAGLVQASCSSMAELVDDNERLRKENRHLNQELTQIKGLCNNILVLMSKYAGAGVSQTAESAAAAVAVAASLEERPPLDLMPMRSSPEGSEAGGASGGESAQGRVKAEEIAMSPMLFGFPISGGKRAREGEEGEQREMQQQPSDPLKVGLEPDPLKSEPLDSGSDHQDSPWMKQTGRPDERVCK